MKNLILRILLSSLTTMAFGQRSNEDRLQNIKSLQRIAFGSCNKQYKYQSLWTDLMQQTPDLWMWGGDNIYANTSDPEKIRQDYEAQNSNPEYRAFKTLTPMIGTWDDHDYTNNGGNGHFKNKEISQKHMLDFIQEPVQSPRRTQKGIYTSYDFKSGENKIKIILIDNRYFKDVEVEYPLLGKAQWQWLEQVLKSSDASLHLIMGGISFLSPEFPFSEEWRDYTYEQVKLLDLVKDKKGVLFLSGDKHFSSIFSNFGHLEFMSSGMTHNTRLPLRPVVKAKFPNVYFQYNYGLIDIDWQGTDPLITLTIRNALGHSALVKKYVWTEKRWKLI